MFEFHHPSLTLIIGPSQSGKTELLTKILNNITRMMTPIPDTVEYYYEFWQEGFKKLKDRGVNFKKGLPSADELTENSLVILDDKMEKLDQLGAGLFTKIIHHKNISVITLMQNIFPKQLCARTMSLNASYIILTSNKRDRSQISCLARQMRPGESRAILEAYDDATSVPFGYILFDFHQKSDDDLRLRTEIFPGERDVAYIKKNGGSSN